MLVESNKGGGRAPDDELQALLLGQGGPQQRAQIAGGSLADMSARRSMMEVDI